MGAKKDEKLMLNLSAMHTIYVVDYIYIYIYIYIYTIAVMWPKRWSSCLLAHIMTNKHTSELSIASLLSTQGAVTRTPV